MTIYKAIFYFLIGCTLIVIFLFFSFGSEKMHRIFWSWLPEEQVKKEILTKPLVIGAYPNCILAQCLHLTAEEMRKEIKKSSVLFSKSEVHQPIRVYILQTKYEKEVLEWTFFVSDSITLTKINPENAADNFCSVCLFN